MMKSAANMRVLLVLLALVCGAGAFDNPRVILFDHSDDLVKSRVEAMELCISKGHCIAHDSQIVADLEQGYTGHHKCGWTWDSQDGKPRHARCLEKDPGNPNVCRPGRSELMNDECPKQEKYGAYCRVQREGEHLPHPCKVEDSDLVEIFRIPGPYMNVDQAKAGCVEHGAVLAYWTQVAAYVDRYDVEFCDYNLLKVKNAVYRINCDHSGEIDWHIINSHSDGYGAICFGHRPHPFKTPCNAQFPSLSGETIYCDQEDWIIVQDRPPCEEEINHFSGRSWHQYNYGFGSPDPQSKKYGGYWLGLHWLHQICSEHKCRIRFEMFDDNDNFYWAEYKSFNLGDENDGVHPPQQYRLHVKEYNERSTAGNALQQLHSGGGTEDGSFFSHGHRDADQDIAENCALLFDSGWWFNKCHRGNLNGVCDDEPNYNPSVSRSRYWHPVNGGNKAGVGLKRTRIKIKVKNNYDNDLESDSDDN